MDIVPFSTVFDAKVLETPSFKKGSILPCGYWREGRRTERAALEDHEPYVSSSNAQSHKHNHRLSEDGH